MLPAKKGFVGMIFLARSNTGLVSINDDAAAAGTGSCSPKMSTRGTEAED